MPTAYRLTALAAAAWLSGCASTRLDTKRPVEVTKVMLGNTFKQDGKPISDLAERLKEHPASAARMDGYYAKLWGANALGFLGIGLITWDRFGGLAAQADTAIEPGRKTSSSNALSLVGAALFVAAFPVAIMADRQLAGAAEAYNASLAPGPGAAAGLRTVPVPYLAATEGADGRRQCVAGVAMRF